MIVFRLRSKILLAFIVIILTGSLLMVGIINISTRQRYQNLVKENDYSFGLSLRGPFTNYYESQRSWIGIENFFSGLQSFPDHMSKRMGRNSRFSNPVYSMLPSFVLADARGQVLINRFPKYLFDRNIIKGDLSNSAIVLYSGDQRIGYILVGSMIESGLNPRERQFLNRTTLIIVLVSIFILALSIIFSYFFSWKISQPISKLSLVALNIAKGDYSGRVESGGGDEISLLSESFNEMAESLEKNSKWRKQIIADSAHELRTPVSLIQGNLEMILEGIYRADKDNIQNIYHETLHLSKLINELQDLSSAESGNMVLNKIEFDVFYLFDNLMKLFRVTCNKKNIKLLNKLDDKYTHIWGDPQKLNQVFTNVLNNAIKYTRERGSIEVSSSKKESFLEIQIKDTGSGIDKEDLHKIFDRFYRTDHSRNRSSGGSGLGLSISKEIINLHKGSIRGESELNKGTSIFISLPFKEW